MTFYNCSKLVSSSLLWWLMWWSFSLLLLLAMLPQQSSFAFLSNPDVVVHVSHNRKTIPKTTNSITSNNIAIRRNTVSSSRLYVFDFFKKRAEEGLDQLSNIADSASKGKLGEGLMNAATYTRQTNQAFADGLAKSRNQFLYNLENMVMDGKDIFDQLEDALLQADLGLQTTQDVLEEVRTLRDGSTKLFTRDDLRSVLRGKLIEILDVERNGNIDAYGRPLSRSIHFADNENELTVLLVMGANGMGKTTTIGKLASRLRVEGGQKVMVAACDTFRAGAVDQLQMWADRAEVDCFCPSEKLKTPSAVLYGAMELAKANNYNTLIVDTSGRLSNNEALNQELLKMKRVIQKFMSSETDADGKLLPNTTVPHEILLVIDAAQGRMALDSSKQWNELLQLTGLILTKLDGSAKGGSVVAVSRELDLPVKLAGVGEGIEDLRDFNPESFVDGLLGIGVASAGSKRDANESKRLEARLVELRKERDARAKEVAINSKSRSNGMNDEFNSNMDVNYVGMEDGDDITPITPITGPTFGRSGNTNNRKNKSKKKRNKSKK